MTVPRNGLLFVRAARGGRFSCDPWAPREQAAWASLGLLPPITNLMPRLVCKIAFTIERSTIVHLDRLVLEKGFIALPACRNVEYQLC